MSRKQGPLAAGMRPAAIAAGHQHREWADFNNSKEVTA